MIVFPALNVVLIITIVGEWRSSSVFKSVKPNQLAYFWNLHVRFVPIRICFSSHLRILSATVLTRRTFTLLENTHENIVKSLAHAYSRRASPDWERQERNICNHVVQLLCVARQSLPCYTVVSNLNQRFALNVALLSNWIHHFLIVWLRHGKSATFSAGLNVINVIMKKIYNEIKIIKILKE